MNFPKLDIQVTNSHLILDKTPGKLDIQGQIPDFTLEKIPHKFDMYIKNAEIEIHNYGPRKQMGLKNIEDLASDYANKGKSEASAAISEYVANGNAMMQIENKGSNPVAEIAVSGSERFSQPGEINVEFFPKEGPRILVTPGNIDVQFQHGEVNFHGQQKLQINYQPEVQQNSIDKYPKVDIEVVGGSVDYIA